MVLSSTRVALPAFDPVELEKLIKALMKIDGASKSEAVRIEVVLSLL
jgi:hypothetical protein